MNPAQSFAPGATLWPLIDRLAWTLLHSLWQGLAIGVAWMVGLALLRDASAAARYLFDCAAIASLPIVVILTFARLQPAQSIQPVASPIMSPAIAPEPQQPAAAPSKNPFLHASVPDAATPLAPVAAPVPTSTHRTPVVSKQWWIQTVALAWIVGVLLFAIYRIGGYCLGRRLLRRGVGAAPAEWMRRFALLQEVFPSKPRAQLLQSSVVQIPCVIGWLRPVVLLPASALTGMNANQLRALLAHELAHVCRQDYLVNLLQTAVETLLFYHPVTWVISRHLRQERECCCDELAARAIGSRALLANALAALEESRISAQLILGAAEGVLVGRIRRLLSQPRRRCPAIGGNISALFLLSAVIIPMACQFGAPPSGRTPSTDGSQLGCMVLVPSEQPSASYELEQLAGGGIASRIPIDNPQILDCDRQSGVLFVGSPAPGTPVGSQPDAKLNVTAFNLGGGTVAGYWTLPGFSAPIYKSPPGEIWRAGENLIVPRFTLAHGGQASFGLYLLDLRTGLFVELPLPRDVDMDNIQTIGPSLLVAESMTGSTVTMYSIPSGAKLGTVDCSSPAAPDVNSSDSVAVHPQLPTPRWQILVLGDRIYDYRTAWEEGGKPVPNGVIRWIAQVRNGRLVPPDSAQSITLPEATLDVQAAMVDGKPMAVAMECGGGMYVANASICDLEHFVIRRQVRLGVRAASGLISPDLQRIWVVDQADGNVKAISVATGAVVITEQAHYPPRVRARVQILAEPDLQMQRLRAAPSVVNRQRGGAATIIAAPADGQYTLIETGIGLRIIRSVRLHAGDLIGFRSLKRNDGESDQAADEALQKPIPLLQFDRLALNDAVKRLSETAGIPMTVDWQALSRLHIEKQETISVTLRNVRPGKILQIILADFSERHHTSDPNDQLTYSIVNGAVSITTMRNTVDTRMYDIHALDTHASDDLKRAELEHELVELVESTCGNGSWQAQGKNQIGQLRVRQQVLIITQSRTVQGEVADLLVKLEEKSGVPRDFAAVAGAERFALPDSDYAWVRN